MFFSSFRTSVTLSHSAEHDTECDKVKKFVEKYVARDTLTG